MPGLSLTGPWWWSAAALLSGLLAATGTSWLIRRLPHLADPDLPAAHHCAAQRAWRGRLPVAGGWFRVAHCRACRHQGWTLLTLVECAIVVLWVGTVLVAGPTWRAAGLALLGTALVMLAVIDLQHLLLPDVVTLPGIAAGLVATTIPGWPVTLLTAALTAAGGYLAMWGLAAAAEHYYQQEAIGQGDWKLVAMLGACLGPSKLMLTLLVGNAVGATVGLTLVALGRDAGRQKLPLGTFLSLTGLGVALL